MCPGSLPFQRQTTRDKSLLILKSIRAETRLDRSLVSQCKRTSKNTKAAKHNKKKRERKKPEEDEEAKRKRNKVDQQDEIYDGQVSTKFPFLAVVANANKTRGRILPYRETLIYKWHNFIKHVNKNGGRSWTSGEIGVPRRFLFVKQTIRRDVSRVVHRVIPCDTFPKYGRARHFSDK